MIPPAHGSRRGSDGRTIDHCGRKTRTFFELCGVVPGGMAIDVGGPLAGWGMVPRLEVMARMVLIPPKFSGLYFTKGQNYVASLEVQQDGTVYADSCEKE